MFGYREQIKNLIPARSAKIENGINLIMKNNIDFYQHYANADQHPKFKMLRVEYGWEGEGRFWALNNRIALSDNCCLDISKKYNKSGVASDLGLTLKEFDLFIEFLLNDCELVRECEPSIITTDIIQENFDKVMVNREKARERKQRWLEKVSKGSLEQLKSSVEPSKKGKERKGKESIYTELKTFLIKNIQPDLKQSEEYILSFYKYRMTQKIKNKKQPYVTQDGINGLFRDLNDCLQAGYNIKDCCDIAKENNWLTPRVSYFENIKLNPLNNKQKVKTIEDREKEEEELFANRKTQ